MSGGVDALDQEDFDSAIVAFTSVLHADPNNGRANYWRALAYAEKGEDQKALADFGEAIRIDPTDADAFNMRGTVHLKGKEYDKAILDFREAIRIHPAKPQAYNNLAWIWATSPKPEVRDGSKAVEYARKCVSIPA